MLLSTLTIRKFWLTDSRPLPPSPGISPIWKKEGSDVENHTEPQQHNNQHTAQPPSIPSLRLCTRSTQAARWRRGEPPPSHLGPAGGGHVFQDLIWLYESKNIKLTMTMFWPLGTDEQALKAASQKKGEKWRGDYQCCLRLSRLLGVWMLSLFMIVLLFAPLWLLPCWDRLHDCGSRSSTVDDVPNRRSENASNQRMEYLADITPIFFFIHNAMLYIYYSWPT